MGKALLNLPLWMVLLRCTKIVSASLSDGSGGIFRPGMVIGGMLAATFRRLGYRVPPSMPTAKALRDRRDDGALSTTLA